jgi:hypothetical protein
VDQKVASSTNVNSRGSWEAESLSGSWTRRAPAGGAWGEAGHHKPPTIAARPCPHRIFSTCLPAGRHHHPRRPDAPAPRLDGTTLTVPVERHNYRLLIIEKK